MAYTTVNKSTDYFNTLLYTGNKTANTTISGVGFESDFTWIKSRTTTENQHAFDAVRGGGNRLYPNLSNQQSNISTTLTSWTSDGFVTGTDDGTNANGQNFVAWNWKAGTTGSGTSSGSGTGKAYSYSVSTTSGFSVVKYTGNGTAGHTIPHHLGAVPKMIIAKNLGRGEHWRVYHASLGNAHKLSLNNTTASASASEWNSTTPTSSVFSIGTGEQINYNDDNYIAYCFAEVKGFSKFGSYTGTGSTLNSPFIYTGFKPAFVIIKGSSNTENWHMYDNKRDTFNPTDQALQPNTNSAEFTETNVLDFLSNGFKLRVTGGGHNGSGVSYIYMAFAEAPLVGSNNVPCTAR